ncbi:hypothetical protein Tco_0045537 [Tanacetum coccineum]
MRLIMKTNFSKPRFASQVDVNNVLSKPVTPYYLPKVREYVLAKPHHVIAPGSFRNSQEEPYGSNDMAHNHYLEEARKKTQEKKIGFKPCGKSISLTEAKEEAVAREVHATHARIVSGPDLEPMQEEKDWDHLWKILYKLTEDDQEKSKVIEESDSTIPDPSHQTVTSTLPVIAPFTDVSSTKPIVLLRVARLEQEILITEHYSALLWPRVHQGIKNLKRVQGDFPESIREQGEVKTDSITPSGQSLDEDAMDKEMSDDDEKPFSGSKPGYRSAKREEDTNLPILGQLSILRKMITKAQRTRSLDALLPLQHQLLPQMKMADY